MKTTRVRSAAWVAAAICAGVVAAVLANLPASGRSHGTRPLEALRPVGTPGAPPATAAGVRQRIDEMDARVRANPDDVAAGVLLAEALLRESRILVDGRPTNRAIDVLNSILKLDPGQYEALRMMGAVELSRHRFAAALDIARRARDERPDDAWNYGVMGDALIELGRYDEAFAAFDRMMSLRPNADAYARVSYGRELCGDLPGALAAMRLAASATGAHDAESQAWYSAHVGALLLKLRRLDEAEREYRRAEFIFPRYPHAVVGLSAVRAARGDADGALTLLVEQLRRTPTLDIAARIGDLYRLQGDAMAADKYYRLAEELGGPPQAQTEAALALFLAEHRRSLPTALHIAQSVAAHRDDIFTNDALAWALFANGRVEEATAAIQRALRTGTRDARILEHAAAIRGAASGGGT